MNNQISSKCAFSCFPLSRGPFKLWNFKVAEYLWGKWWLVLIIICRVKVTSMVHTVLSQGRRRMTTGTGYSRWLSSTDKEDHNSWSFYHWRWGIPHLCAPHLFSCAPHTFLAFSWVRLFGCCRFGSDPNWRKILTSRWRHMWHQMTSEVTSRVTSLLPREPNP